MPDCFAVGVNRHRSLGCQFAVMDSFCEVGGLGALSKVLSQLGRVFVEPAGIGIFEGAPDFLMDADASGREDLLVKGLAEESVGEAETEAARHLALLDDCSPLRLFEGSEQLFL